MLRNKRIVITGTGRDFGRVLAIQLAKEGAHLDLCARHASAAEHTLQAVCAAGGKGRVYSCDLSQPASIRHATGALLADARPIDILVLNAAPWLEGELGDDDCEESIIATLNGGLTGSILFTRALLPALQRAPGADIVVMLSACAEPGYYQSRAHPAFYAAKHGLAGFCNVLRERFKHQDIRVIGMYPPDFVTPDASSPIPCRQHGELLDAEGIANSVKLALSQARNCHISAIHFHGPTRQDLGA